MAESSTTSELQTLLEEGKAALLAGDTYEARQRFRRATELEPENVEAWKGLAGSVRPYSEKREYLQQALKLDPTNSELRASLEYVENKIAAGEYLAPRGVTAPEPLSTPEATAPQDDTTVDGDTGEAAHIDVPAGSESATSLRCISCGNPITDTNDVVWTPVGQLCPECARARRPRNYQVSASTLVLAASVSLISSILVSFLVVLFLRGFFLSFIIAFIVAPIVAEFIVRVLDRLTHAKRGREMQLTVGFGIGVGAATTALLLVFTLQLLLFTIITISTAVARLR